jgi:hypothetical protein
MAFSLHPNAVLTFSPATEFDSNLLVHVLAQIKNVFLLRSLSLSRCPSALSTSTTTTSTASIAASSTASPTPECASLRHVVRFGFGRARWCRKTRLLCTVTCSFRALKMARASTPPLLNYHVTYVSHPPLRRWLCESASGRYLFGPDMDAYCAIFKSPRPEEQLSLRWHLVRLYPSHIIIP